MRRAIALAPNGYENSGGKVAYGACGGEGRKDCRQSGKIR